MIRAFQEEGSWCVWLDPDDTQLEPRSGLCIGVGSSLAEARADAIEYLGEMLKELIQMSPQTPATPSKERVKDSISLAGAGHGQVKADEQGRDDARPACCRAGRPAGGAVRFVCRCCGSQGQQAFEDAHCCAECWDAWEARLEMRFLQDAALSPGCLPAHRGAGRPDAIIDAPKISGVARTDARPLGSDALCASERAAPDSVCFQSAVDSDGPPPLGSEPSRLAGMAGAGSLGVRSTGAAPAKSNSDGISLPGGLVSTGSGLAAGSMH